LFIVLKWFKIFSILVVTLKTQYLCTESIKGVVLNSLNSIGKQEWASWNKCFWSIRKSDSIFHLFITQSVLRQAHSLFQSEFSSECDQVLLLAVDSILSFPQGRPVDAYVFFLLFPTLIFLLSFLQLRVLEGTSYATCDQSKLPSLFLLYAGYSCST
jgi:hypothetical protein